jgi:hypothetical protein
MLFTGIGRQHGDVASYVHPPRRNRGVKLLYRVRGGVERLPWPNQFRALTLLMKGIASTWDLGGAAAAAAFWTSRPSGFGICGVCALAIRAMASGESDFFYINNSIYVTLFDNKESKYLI